MSVPPAPTLCDRCSPMFQGSFSTRRRSGEHHASSQSLEEAADRNCIICRDVWKELIRISDFDRKALHVRAAKQGLVTSCHMYDGSVVVKCFLRQPVATHFYRFVETQRTSALEPARV
jgi:hypothetical protein